jgi:diacylglycerol kinase family enzyme
VFVARARGPLDALAAGWEALRGSVGSTGRGRRVLRARARRVEIRVRPRRVVELDGSEVGRTPVKIKVRPACLVVLVPAT